MLELNLGLKKSDDFILSGKWQPCVRAHCQLEKKTAHSTDPIPSGIPVLLQRTSEMSIIIMGTQ